MFELDKFKFIIATDDSIKEQIYRLRYDVYAMEFGFEKLEDHPSGLEFDAYDRDAVHFAALYDVGETTAVIGTMRLVLDSENGFPIEHAAKLEHNIKIPGRNKIAEISRLAVSSMFRRRQEDGIYGVESYLKKSEGSVLPDHTVKPAEYDRRKHPVIILGLYRMMYHESKRLGITHWYMISEKKLHFSLKKYGFIFHQIGDPVEYHGLRIPYIGSIEEMEQKFIKTNPVFLKRFLVGLEEQYQPKF